MFSVWASRIIAARFGRVALQRRLGKRAGHMAHTRSPTGQGLLKHNIRSGAHKIFAGNRASFLLQSEEAHPTPWLLWLGWLNQDACCDSAGVGSGPPSGHRCDHSSNSCWHGFQPSCCFQRDIVGNGSKNQDWDASCLCQPSVADHAVLKTS